MIRLFLYAVAALFILKGFFVAAVAELRQAFSRRAFMVRGKPGTGTYSFVPQRIPPHWSDDDYHDDDEYPPHWADSAHYNTGDK